MKNNNVKYVKSVGSFAVLTIAASLGLALSATAQDPSCASAATSAAISCLGQGTAAVLEGGPVGAFVTGVTCGVDAGKAWQACNNPDAAPSQGGAGQNDSASDGSSDESSNDPGGNSSDDAAGSDDN